MYWQIMLKQVLMTRREDVAWIHLALNGIQYQTVLDRIMNLSFNLEGRE
jgi:hypothetical protein